MAARSRLLWNVLRGFSVKVEIVNSSDEIVYRAEGVAELELDHDVIGHLHFLAEPVVELDVFEGCPGC